MSSRPRASTPSAFDEEATYRPHQRTHLAASPSPPTVLLRPRQHLPPLVAYRLPPRAAAPRVGYVLAPLVPEPIDLHLPPPLPAALTIEMAVQDDGADWLAVRTAVQEDAAAPAEGERETPQGPDPGGREGADMDGADAGGSFLPETPERPTFIDLARQRGAEERAAALARSALPPVPAQPTELVRAQERAESAIAAQAAKLVLPEVPKLEDRWAPWLSGIACSKEQRHA